MLRACFTTDRSSADMSRHYYNLPPLTSLAAFECAARHLSFKAAATELGVTPGAVSHQVKSLETELNIVLFNRVHRGVELTDAGERLAERMAAAFFDISGVLQTLREQPENSGVTVGATTAMSSLWLTPSILRYWRSHPEQKVNQIVSDTLEFGAKVPDLVISYGPFNHPGFANAPLFRDQLVPVCSAKLAKDTTPTTLEELAALPLIHLDAPDKRWTSWATWFAELGYSGALRRGIKVNNYMIALQAAQDEAGMVLGWKHLVSPLLDNGSLVSLDAFSIPAPTSFFLSYNDQLAADDNLQSLKHWITTQASTVSDELNSP